MTFAEFAEFLRSEGFSAGDIFGLFNQYVTDLDRVTVPVLKRALPEFRQYISFLRRYEEAIIERTFGENT